MSVSAVLFDFDDTLVDSLPARLAALQSVFDSVGIENLSAREFLGEMGGRALDVSLRELARDRGIKTNLFVAYAGRYWTKPPGSLSLFPGVADMLAELASQFDLGLVTNKTRSFTQLGVAVGAAVELTELGLAEVFGVVVGYEDAGAAKPNPSGLLLAMDRLGVSPSETLYVGDSAADMAAATAAECVPGFAKWGSLEPPASHPDPNAAARPGVTFNAPNEVGTFLRRSAQAGSASTSAK